MERVHFTSESSYQAAIIHSSNRKAFLISIWKSVCVFLAFHEGISLLHIFHQDAGVTLTRLSTAPQQCTEAWERLFQRPGCRSHVTARPCHFVWDHLSLQTSHSVSWCGDITDSDLTELSKFLQTTSHHKAFALPCKLTSQSNLQFKPASWFLIGSNQFYPQQLTCRLHADV